MRDGGLHLTINTKYAETARFLPMAQAMVREYGPGQWMPLFMQAILDERFDDAAAARSAEGYKRGSYVWPLIVLANFYLSAYEEPVPEPEVEWNAETKTVTVRKAPEVTINVEVT